jgi:hypothetical protein
MKPNLCVKLNTCVWYNLSVQWYNIWIWYVDCRAAYWIVLVSHFAIFLGFTKSGEEKKYMYIYLLNYQTKKKNIILTYQDLFWTIKKVLFGFPVTVLTNKLSQSMWHRNNIKNGCNQKCYLSLKDYKSLAYFRLLKNTAQTKKLN